MAKNLEAVAVAAENGGFDAVAERTGMVNAENGGAALGAAADELLRMAEEGGVEQNYFFRTTFERYKALLNILNRLQTAIENDDPMITKEYVKGRENLMIHPAIKEYNKTCSTANETAKTLLKIIEVFAEGPVMNRADTGDEDIDL